MTVDFLVLSERLPHICAYLRIILFHTSQIFIMIFQHRKEEKTSSQFSKTQRPKAFHTRLIADTYYTDSNLGIRSFRQLWTCHPAHLGISPKVQQKVANVLRTMLKLRIKGFDTKKRQILPAMWNLCTLKRWRVARPSGHDTISLPRDTAWLGTIKIEAAFNEAFLPSTPSKSLCSHIEPPCAKVSHDSYPWHSHLHLGTLTNLTALFIKLQLHCV